MTTVAGILFLQRRTPELQYLPSPQAVIWRRCFTILNGSRRQEVVADAGKRRENSDMRDGESTGSNSYVKIRTNKKVSFNKILPEGEL